MELFFLQVFSGLATGGVYASLALALVMIYHSTNHMNFAQAEMAMFSTYICWWLITLGTPFWVAFFGALVISFLGGVFIERVIIRPFHKAPVLNSVIVFIGLLVIFNSMAILIFTPDVRPFPSPFPEAPIKLGGLVFGSHEAGAIGVTLVLLLVLFAFFRYTPLGLAMRAAAENPESSKLVGIRVGWMLALGWGLAAALGSVAGIMVAPILFLEPNMLGGALLYAFAAALFGGITSPGGAVFGGFFLGVLENLAGTYVPFIGNELKLTVALVIIVGVLLFKPSGLFGKVAVTRV